MSRFIYANKDNSVWQSKTREQFDDQPDWTSYHLTEEFVGIQRLQGIGKGNDKYVKSKDEIYVYQMTNDQANFDENKDVYITNDENPNGKLITLGSKEVIKDKAIRHHQSFPSDGFVIGHSLSKDTVFGINDYNNIFFKNRICLVMSNGCSFENNLVQDSPFGEGTGYSLKSSNTTGDHYADYRIDILKENHNGFLNHYGPKNRFYSFFYKRPSDVNYKQDGDGNDLGIAFFYLMVAYDTKMRDRNFNIVFYENSNGGINIYRADTNTKKISAIYGSSKEDNLLNDGKWHHIVFQILDDGNIVLYVDNKVQFDDYKSSYHKDTQSGDNFEGNTIVGFFPREDRLGIRGAESGGIYAPEGCLVSQFEMYIDVYNPDEDDYQWFTRSDDDHILPEIVKYDISNEGLESTPTNIYKIPTNKILCSMAPDADSIDDNFEEIDLIDFTINVDENQLDEDRDHPQPVDELIRKYDPETKQGRAFATKIECNLGDIIKPGLYTYLSAE